MNEARRVKRENLPDGITNLGALEDDERYADEYDELEDIDDEISDMKYPRENDKCITPCPRYDCMLEPDTCNTNCNQTLEIPCLICENKCSPKLKRILLKPEVQKYQKYSKIVKDKEIPIMYPDTIGQRRSELIQKKEKIREKQRKILNYAEESILPQSLALKLKSKKIRKINRAIEQINTRLDEQVALFKS